MKLKRVPLEASVALYLTAWIPYFVLNRGLASVVQPALGAARAGLEVEILPRSMIFLTLFTYLFLWAGGGGQARVQLEASELPRPRPGRPPRDAAASSA